MGLDCQAIQTMDKKRSYRYVDVCFVLVQIPMGGKPQLDAAAADELSCSFAVV